MCRHSSPLEKWYTSFHAEIVGIDYIFQNKSTHTQTEIYFYYFTTTSRLNGGPNNVIIY